MKTPDGTLRTIGYPLSVLLISVALAACGGGGGGTTSSSGGVTPGMPVGPAVVEITLAAAPATGSAAAPVTVAGPSSVPTPDPAYKWPWEIPEPSPKIEHVFMEIVKVSLMPAEEAFDSEDMEGEIQGGNSVGPTSPPDKSRFITSVVDPPICIDLLKLENGKKLGRLLNRFDQVPAGTYDKIRVYYQKVRVHVEGRPDPVYFHPTAHSKFDIHFRQGHELAIPVATDTTQKAYGWVKFFRVKIDFVGLKLRIVNATKDWDKAKVILRPQIFAEGGNDILYSVAGTADEVPEPTLPFIGEFNVKFGTGPTVIPVAFNNDPVSLQNKTTWAYSDDVLGHSSWIVNNIPDPMTVPIFRSGAKVMAIGPFDTSLTLQATEIVFTFPHVREGRSDNVWIPPDNTSFIIRSTDNVTVFPNPTRELAYYDNLALPHNPLDNTYLDNNLLVRARGYFEVSGAPDLILRSYWISIDGPYAGP